jgi:hypothetical protein
MYGKKSQRVVLKMGIFGCEVTFLGTLGEEFSGICNSKVLSVVILTVILFYS